MFQMDAREQLSQSLDAFVIMQREQLQELKNGRFGRIQEWLEMRQETLARLRQHFQVVDKSGIDEGFKEELLDKLGRVISREKIIDRMATGQKESLAGKLSGMRRGKKALGGYGANSRKRRPKFVSSKG